MLASCRLVFGLEKAADKSLLHLVRPIVSASSQIHTSNGQSTSKALAVWQDVKVRFCFEN
jgi:hypothetical protein